MLSKLSKRILTLAFLTPCRYEPLSPTETGEVGNVNWGSIDFDDLLYSDEALQVRSSPNALGDDLRTLSPPFAVQ